MIGWHMELDSIQNGRVMPFGLNVVDETATQIGKPTAYVAF